MKKIMFFAMLMASVFAMTCCSSDDPFKDFNNGDNMSGKMNKMNDEQNEQNERFSLHLKPKFFAF